MKRFLVFCIIILVSVTIGYMTFYFLRDNEQLLIDITDIQLNVGEDRTIELEHLKPKSTTVITYSLPDDQTVCSFDVTTNKIVAIDGGSTVMTITTNNENIEQLIVKIDVGDGSKLNPFFVRNQTDLMNIGTGTLQSGFGVTCSYRLTTDIQLTNNTVWTPIDGESGFSGVFYGDFHTISNINISSSDDCAGFFGRISANGVVQYLTLNDITINGAFDNVGCIAGINYGSISNCYVTNGSITNTASGSECTTGGLVGINSIVDENSAEAHIAKCSAYVTISANGSVGGIAGINCGSYIYNCLTGDLSSVSSESATSVVGGLVGVNRLLGTHGGIVKDCFNLATITQNGLYSGAIIGNNEIDTINVENKILNIVVGCYYKKNINDTFWGVGSITEDVTNGLAAHALWEIGVLGVQGATVDQLKEKGTFISHLSRTGEIVTWDFSNSWEMLDLGTPVLRIDGANVGIQIGSMLYANTIIDKSVFLTSFKTNGKYVIEQDIDLEGVDWIALCGEEEFTGSLSGTWLPEENRYTKIFNFVLTSGDNVGFFDTIGYKGSVSDLCFETVSTTNASVPEYITADSLGIVAGLNYGTIANITIGGLNNIKVISKMDATETYVGGLVGSNFGSISNVCGEIGSIEGKSINSSSYTGMFVGGFVGKNVERVMNCGITGGEVILTGSFAGAVGGIVGVNVSETFGTAQSSAVIQSCYNLNTTIISSEVADKKYGLGAGGIVGSLKSGMLRYCVSNGYITGYMVGGIAGINYGEISENYFSGNATGFYVGGVAGVCYYPATVLNNRIDGILTNVAVDNAVKAGITARALRVNDKKVVLQHNFVNCSFEGTFGSNCGEVDSYREWPEGIVFDTPEDYCYRSDNVINNDVVLNYKDCQDFSYTVYVWFGAPTTVKTNTAQASGSGSDGYAIFIHSANFDDTIWNFISIGDLPILKNLVVIPSFEE